eukprot:5189671-Karenia_brevis.AAC.1
MGKRRQCFSAVMVSTKQTMEQQQQLQPSQQPEPLQQQPQQVHKAAGEAIQSTEQPTIQPICTTSIRPQSMGLHPLWGGAQQYAQTEVQNYWLSGRKSICSTDCTTDKSQSWRPSIIILGLTSTFAFITFIT